MKFINYHKPEPWKYKKNNNTYIRVGNMEELVIFTHNKREVYLPSIDTEYKSIKDAYMVKNRLFNLTNNYKD